MPGERWYGLIHKDWPGFVAVGEEVRCVGDFIAAVAAVDAATAHAAAALIDVRYGELKPVTDPALALKPCAHQINPTRPNKMDHTCIRRGDVQAVFANSAHVVRGDFQTQPIEHLFLEPECALAEPGDAPGTFKLYTQGQGVFDDRRQVAAFLDMPEEDLYVELVPNGGAFGGKEDMSIQAHAAQLAKMTGQPMGEGKLTAIQAEFLGDSGSFATVHLRGPQSNRPSSAYSSRSSTTRLAGSSAARRSAPRKRMIVGSRPPS